MKKFVRAVLASTILFVGSTVAIASPQDVAAIQAQLDSITASYVKGDAIGAMAPYLNDKHLIVYDLMPPIQHPGYAGNLRTTQDIINAAVGPITIKYEDVHIVVDHKHAYGYYLVHTAANMKDHAKIDLIQRTNDFFEKVGNKWLIIFEESSVPIDMVNGTADLHSDQAPDRLVFKKK